MRTTWRLLSAIAGLLVLLGVASAQGAIFTFVPGGANDWWMTDTNWSPYTPGVVPNSVNDIAVFDASASPSYTTNVHSQYYTVQEMKFATTSTWQIFNARQDPRLQAPSGSALITQNGSGAVTFNTDLILASSVIFGGTGTGNITVNGSQSADYRGTVRGAGGLTMNGSYTLTFNTPVSYQGATVINAGTVLFNSDSLAPLPGPDDQGFTVTGYTPANLAPITVNSGGRLGGIGHLLADVTVNSGGVFAPGSPGLAPSATRMSLNSLNLQAGSTTAFDLGGAAPGNPGTGTGYYDQVAVANQLSLRGTLNVALTGGYTPTALTTYTIFTYGSLNPAANSFSTVNLPTFIPAGHPNWSWTIDYGTGTNSQVNVRLQANPWYWTGGAYDPGYVSPNPATEPANQPWWAIRANWSYNGKPGFDTANPDVVIFDDAHLHPLAPHETNIHDVGPGWIQELQVNTSSGWHFYNNNRTLAMKNPVAGQPARFTQKGTGAVLVDDDIQLVSDTIFGGTGTGTVTVNGYLLAGRQGIFGSANLIKQGPYDLVINKAGYTGATTISGGRLLFNTTSATTQGLVTVMAGGALGGTGVLHAPVTVQAGGIFAPGQSPGILTVDSLTLEPGAISRMEVGGPTPGNGAGFHDQAFITGLLSLGGTVDVQFVGGYQPALGQSFVFFRYGSLDPAHNTFDTPPRGYLVDYGTGVNSQITLTLVPEPSTLVLALLGSAAVALLWRRRR